MLDVNKKNEVKLASDNKVSLFNIENIFSDLNEVVTTFFPSFRFEKLLRYRAETIAKVGIEAYKIAKSENIQINPLPPKIALPLVEKLSLEDEPDMFERWAKLLIAAGVNPNPIHQQYADILSGLNSQSANLLKEIYMHQENIYLEKEFDDYLDKSRFKKYFDDANKDNKSTVFIEGRPAFSLPSSFHVFPFRFPFIICGTEKGRLKHFGFKADGSASGNSVLLEFKDETIKMLLSLEKMGLIKYQHIFHDQKKDENGKIYFISNCGVLLTQFGYSFTDCLENPTK